MKVQYINHMGSDLEVANDARVSFDKISELETDGSLKVSDERIIRFLARENHWSPFSHSMAKFRVAAPFGIARQLWKSHIGLANQDESVAWNEVSRRYVDKTPEAYVPVFRKRSADKKQGSSDELVNDVVVDTAYRAQVEDAILTYEMMIERGVSPEQARFVLPVGTMTEWIWTGSLHAFARICNQRLAPDAQGEARDIAALISTEMARLFPVSWKVLTNG